MMQHSDADCGIKGVTSERKFNSITTKSFIILFSRNLEANQSKSKSRRSKSKWSGGR
jgi:hypothetical protein